MMHGQKTSSYAIHMRKICWYHPPLSGRHKGCSRSRSL